MPPQTDLPLNGTTTPPPQTSNETNSYIGLIPFFDGFTSIHNFFDKLESIAELSNWTERQKIRAASLRLTGKAASFASLAKLSTLSYKDFKQKLYDQFTLDEDHFSALTKFMNCTQMVGESVKDYAMRLQTLADRTKRLYDDENQQQYEDDRVRKDLLEKFVQGLNKHVQPFIFFQKCDNLENAIKFADEYERSHPPSVSILKTAPSRSTTPTRSPSPKPSRRFSYQDNHGTQRRDSDSQSFSSRRRRDSTPDPSPRRQNHLRYNRDRSQTPTRPAMGHQRNMQEYRREQRYSQFNQRRGYSARPSFQEWRRPTPSTAHPCFECGATTHWVASCPERRPRRPPPRFNQPARYSDVTRRILPQGNEYTPKDRRGLSISPRTPSIPSLRSNWIPNRLDFSKYEQA